MSIRSLNDLLDTVAGSLSEPADLQETLSRITRSARDNVPGADYASISIRQPDDHLETIAPTSPLIYDADQLQYELHEGPCYDAVTDEAVAYSPDLAHDTRWPSFGPRAAALGMGSQMAIRLTHKGDSYTGLNLYSRELAAFDDPDGVAQLFSGHARVALGYASELDMLRSALATRQIIGEAIGISMERYRLTEERAFEFLIRVSQTSNVKLRDVAADIVGTATGRDATSSP